MAQGRGLDRGGNRFSTKLDRKQLEKDQRPKTIDYENWFHTGTVAEGLVEKDLVCDDSDEGCGSCFKALIPEPEEGHEKGHIFGTCPQCNKPKLVCYWGSYMQFGFKMKGPGFHSTKQGQRQKRERTRDIAKLRETQWENHEPTNVRDPSRVRNPTPGGVYDPNSKFNKGKRRKT